MAVELVMESELEDSSAVSSPLEAETSRKQTLSAAYFGFEGLGPSQPCHSYCAAIILAYTGRL